MKAFASMMLVLWAVWSGQAVAQTEFGTFTGVFKNEILQKEQLAKLDFVIKESTSQQVRLIAILSLYFGSFESDEYITYHFDNVLFDFATGKMVFNQPDQDVSLKVDRFSSREFVAHVNYLGDVGTVEFKKSLEVSPTKDLVSRLAGEYTGMCNGTKRILQVQTSRSPGDTSRVGNPFGSYEVTAQIAEENHACWDDSACVVHVYQEGSYNFLHGDLKLTGRAENLNCKVSHEGLTCNDCLYVSDHSDEVTTREVFKFPIKGVEWKAPDTTSDPVTTLAGDYKGYVYHERLGRFQESSMVLTTFQAPDDETGRNQLTLSAEASLKFSPRTRDHLSYKFGKMKVPLIIKTFAIQRMEDDVDAIVQINKIDKGQIEGTWYSMLYGRVGAFVMRKDGAVPLPEGAKTYVPILGDYRAGDWFAGFEIVKETTPLSTRNPFYPLNFKGYFRLSNITANQKVQSGSYDFYTGKISFVLENGSFFIGNRDADGVLYLKRPTNGVTRPLQPQEPFVFQKL